MFNETAANNLEAAASISRRARDVGCDCANLLQEWADRLRKEDHELSQIELAEMCGQYKGMLVFK